MSSMRPKRTKFRKKQRGSVAGLSKGGNFLNVGDYGIKAYERGFISEGEMEAARIAANRYLKRQGRIYILHIPDKPVTALGLQVRMGKGKGAVKGYVTPIRPGVIILEVGGVPEADAIEALRLASEKLSVRKTGVVRHVHRV